MENPSVKNSLSEVDFIWALEDKTAFEKLPNELLLEIFKQAEPQELKSLSLVNRRFYRMASFLRSRQGPELEKKIARIKSAIFHQIREKVGEHASEKALQTLVKRLFDRLFCSPENEPEVLEIRALTNYVDGLTFSEKSEIPERLDLYFPHLRSLEFKNVRARLAGDLSYLPKNLHTLVLNCRLYSKGNLTWLPKNLKSLSINWNDLDDRDLNSLPKSLKHLRLGYSSGMNGKSYQALPKHLESLDLSGNRYEIARIKDEDLKDLPPNLTSLNLGGQKKLTDRGVQFLADNLKNLTSLNLSRCDRITNEGLVALSQLHLKILTL